MHWKKFAADYLAFNRRDRVAVIGLLILILGVYFLPSILPAPTVSPAIADSSMVQALARLETKGQEWNKEHEDFTHAGYPYDRKDRYYPKSRGELFEFDPNLISVSEWKKLGLREKTIGTIRNYLAKGGKFRKPEDLKRVYGLFEDEYERLEPFIRIGNEQLATGNEQLATTKAPVGFGEKTKTTSFKDFTIYDINTADTSQLIALPGIGSKLASRIINFRDKLGGFYSIEQVGETFGLSDSTFQKIKKYLKLGKETIKKINLNTVTLEELKAHPYIRYAIAAPVIAYRNEHGLYKKIEDLKNVMAVTDAVFKKIENYISVN